MWTSTNTGMSHFHVTNYFSDDDGPSVIWDSVIVTVVIGLFIACRASTDWCSLEPISVFPRKTICGVADFRLRNVATLVKESFGHDHRCRCYRSFRPINRPIDLVVFDGTTRPDVARPLEAYPALEHRIRTWGSLAAHFLRVCGH